MAETFVVLLIGGLGQLIGGTIGGIYGVVFAMVVIAESQQVQAR
jgi:hypothetical protein